MTKDIANLQRVRVEQEHIDHGEPDDPLRCPVAYALGSIEDGGDIVTEVCVSDGTITVHMFHSYRALTANEQEEMEEDFGCGDTLQDRETATYLMRPKMERWILSFDEGKDVRPGEFALGKLLGHARREEVIDSGRDWESDR